MRARKDSRDIPGYTIKEAASYLDLPTSTVRVWACGQDYTTRGGRRRAAPLLPLAQKDPPNLSFWNLVEVYVLATIRRVHEVPMPKLRAAIEFLRNHPKFRVDRPLLHKELYTDGIDLFIQELGLIVVSQSGQGAVPELIRGSLQRIEHDSEGLASQLFPWRKEYSERRIVEINPGRAFGRLAIAGTGIPVKILSDRFHAGEKIDDLAADYKLDRDQIEEAIRWDLRVAA